VRKTRGVVAEEALPSLLGTGLEDSAWAAVVVGFKFCGGAAGSPLIGLRPSSAANALGRLKVGADADEDGVYDAKTVDFAMMLVTVTVFWRGMTPATTGPARRAEIKMLESIAVAC
jgi:hypothetical protein